jgi:hypothetical protein
MGRERELARRDRSVEEGGEHGRMNERMKQKSAPAAAARAKREQKRARVISDQCYRREKEKKGKRKSRSFPTHSPSVAVAPLLPAARSLALKQP